MPLEQTRIPAKATPAGPAASSDLTVVHGAQSRARYGIATQCVSLWRFMHPPEGLRPAIVEAKAARRAFRVARRDYGRRVAHDSKVLFRDEGSGERRASSDNGVEIYERAIIVSGKSFPIIGAHAVAADGSTTHRGSLLAGVAGTIIGGLPLGLLSGVAFGRQRVEGAAYVRIVTPAMTTFATFTKKSLGKLPGERAALFAAIVTTAARTAEADSAVRPGRLAAERAALVRAQSDTASVESARESYRAAVAALPSDYQHHFRDVDTPLDANNVTWRRVLFRAAVVAVVVVLLIAVLYFAGTQRGTSNAQKPSTAACSLKRTLTQVETAFTATSTTWSRTSLTGSWTAKLTNGLGGPRNGLTMTVTGPRQALDELEIAAPYSGGSASASMIRAFDAAVRFVGKPTVEPWIGRVVSRPHRHTSDFTDRATTLTFSLLYYHTSTPNVRTQTTLSLTINNSSYTPIGQVCHPLQ